MTQAHFPLFVPHATATQPPLTVTAPYDGATIATVDIADAAIVEQALSTAFSLYQDQTQWIPPYKRVAILEKLATLMADQVDELARQAAHEGGKPFMDSQVEARRAVDGIKLCIETLRTQTGDVVPMRTTASAAHRVAFTQKQPIGVVVAVSAFNHPLNLIVHQVGAAVAAGCPVIVKPASDTPLSCLRLLELFYNAGLPPAWAQGMVIPDNALATTLATDPRVAFFSFIGSAKVGWMLRNKLAPGTRCALEHGGVAPVVVAEDADLTQAVPLLTKGGFYHAGQVCVSVQRIYAHQSIARELATQLAKRAQALKIGDPTQSDTEVGPLIRHQEVDRVASWVEAAVSGGAKLFCGGKKISDSCYACTVLYAPSAEAQVTTHEVFGPVVCVYPYEQLDEAIAAANALPFSFQAAVFTKTIDTAMRVYQRINASAVMVNDHTAFRVDGMPFAGLKQSGLGVGGIPYSMHDMQIDKLMVLQSSELP